MNKANGWDFPLNMVSGRTYYFNRKSLERLTDERFLEGYGFKVYSQYDEDGILQEIFRRIGTTDCRFVEFGVENGLECNSHYLLLKGWQGLWIEGSETHYWSIQYRFYHAIHSGMLQVANRMVTKDNINQIIAEHGIQGEIDLLSVDIDTNDYYVLKAIDVIQPRVVVAEYNAKFPPPVEWTRLYDEVHGWDGSDDTGVSLCLLDRMMNEKGYSLVGTCLSGVNAFFVRHDLLGDHFLYEHTAENLYNAARFGGGNGLYFGGGHPARRFLGNQFANGYRIDGQVKLNVVGVTPEWLQSLRQIQDLQIFLWGAGECGQIMLQVLQQANLSNNQNTVFCDVAHAGKKIQGGVNVVGYAEMENRYDPGNTVVFLTDLDRFWENAYRALSRGKIDKVYHVLSILGHVETTALDIYALMSRYGTVLRDDRIFAAMS